MTIREFPPDRGTSPPVGNKSSPPMQNWRSLTELGGQGEPEARSPRIPRAGSLSGAHPADKGAKARRVAEQLSDAFAKQTLLDIARSYHNLAVLTETRPASDASG